MKNKVTMFILASVCAFSLAACGNAASDSGSNTSSQAASTSKTTASSAKASSPKAASQKMTDTDVKVGDTVVSLNEDVSQAVDALGKDYQYTEDTACEHPGFNKVYDYKDVELVGVPDDSEVYNIEDIVALTDQVELSNGLKIGSSVSDVEAAYQGKDLQKTDTSIVYETKSWGVLFETDQDKVTSIDLYVVK